MPLEFLRPAVDGVGEGVADRVVVGFNWTAIHCADHVGMAWSPRGIAGARTTAETGTYAGRSLAELALLCRSDNPYERSIGLAAVNAYWNRPSDALAEGDGLATWSQESDARRKELERTVVIGRFPNLDSKFPGATVVELEPREGEIAFADAGSRIAAAQAVVMTASTLVNNTAESILDLVPQTARVTIVGPSVPLCPGLLDGPVRRLAGFVVSKPNEAFSAVMEGAGAKALKRFGRSVTLTVSQV